MNRAENPADRNLRITAYNQDLGFVTERRRMNLVKGLSRIEVTDIPALIDPTSVHLASGEGDIRVVEQNFQYDLADAGRILRRYLDHPIEAVLKEGEIKRGDLLSFDDHCLVMRSEGGEIGVVLRTEVVDVRLPSLPEGLRARPTLLWLIESDAARDAALELSYLTGGMAWRAEYIAVANEDDSEVELAAWISLENQSGAGFSEARLQLMAGEVNRVRQPRLLPSADDSMEYMLMKRKAAVQEEPLFEYHLYALDEIVTVANCETKQLALFPSVRTAATKSYRYEGGRHSRNVQVFMELENREDRGLGIPLPAGKIRTFKKDSGGRLQFIGEDTVEHTPQNEKIKLTVGTAFDIVGERKVVSDKRLSKEEAAEDIEVRVRNRKPQPVEVTVRETLWSHWRIMKSSHEYTPRNANSVDFKLTVPANGEEVLTFAYRHGV